MLEIDKDAEFSWNMAERKEDGTVAIVYTTLARAKSTQDDEKV